jgi:hypothetical protein
VGTGVVLAEKPHVPQGPLSIGTTALAKPPETSGETPLF